MPSLAIAVPIKRRANKNELAEFFGVSLPAVDAWIRKDIPAVQRGRKGAPWVFDLRAVAQWYYSSAVGETEDGEIDPERMEPRDRKDWYDGESKRRDIAEKAGELMTVEDYMEGQAVLLKGIAASLETLPDLLERRCNLKPDAIELVREVLDDHRTEVANRILSDDRSNDTD